MKVEDTVTIVVEKDGRFLLIRKARGRADAGDWAFPGGHVDEGESLLDAMKRETMEEIGDGAEISEHEPFFSFMHDVPKSSKFHKHMCHAFKGRLTGEIKPGDDAEAFAWFTKDEILNNPKVQDFVKTIIKKMFP